jgi:hypothetical protein
MSPGIFNTLGCRVKPQKAKTDMSFGLGLQLLEDQLRTHRDQADETLVNMLAEVYMDAQEWQKGFLLIREEEEVICKGSTLPADLQVLPAMPEKCCQKTISLCCR